MNRRNYSVSLLFLVLAFLLSAGSSCVLAVSEEAIELNKKAELAISSGLHNDAVQLLKELQTLEPTWGRPYYTASKLLRLRNDRMGVIKNMRRACSLEPKNEEYREEYLKLLFEELENAEKQNNTDRVNTLRKEILTVKPGWLPVVIPVIKDLISEGKTGKALEKAEETLKLNNDMRNKYNSAEMGELFLILANIYYDEGKYYNARRHADDASKYALDNPESVKRLLADIRKKQAEGINEIIEEANKVSAAGDPDKALSILKKAEAIDPRNESVQNLADRIIAGMDVKKAVIEAKKMISANKWLQARDLLETICASTEDKEAAELLRQAAEKEETLLKKIDRSGRLPRSQEEIESLLANLKRLAAQYEDAKNRNGAKRCISQGLDIIEFIGGMPEELSYFKKKMEEINQADSHDELWKRALDSRNVAEYDEMLKCLKALPHDYDIQLPSYLAEAYWKTGDEDSALHNANYQLTAQPENNRAKFVLGSIMLERGDKDTAYRHFKEIFDSDPEYPEINDKLLASSVSKAVNYLPLVFIAILLGIAYAMHKYMPEYKKNRAIRIARSYLNKGMLDECIKELTAVRRLPILTPYDGAVMSRIMAQAYLKKGIYDRAIGECKHLLSISQADEEAHKWLGSAYLGRRMVSPETLPELLRLYKQDSRNFALVSLLGSHYTQAKNLSEDGIQILEQWLNLDPNNAEVLKPLGRYYLSKGRSDDKAMKVFQKMMEFGSPETEFLLGVAKIYLKLRQFDDCLRICEQVINADTNNSLVHAVLREAYAKQNRLNELLDIYGSFLQNNPYNVAFQNGLKDATEMAAQMQNAANMRQQQAAFDPMGRSAAPEQETAPASDDAAPQPEEPSQAEAGSPCPNCGHINSTQDYCCQQCGRNLI